MTKTREKVRGEKHGRATISDAMATEVWRLHRETGAQGLEIARTLGVEDPGRAGELFNHILAGRSWNHVTGLPYARFEAPPPKRPKGEKHHNVVLDESTVREAWRLHIEEGLNAPGICTRLGFKGDAARHRIYNIITGCAWNWLTGLPVKYPGRVRSEGEKNARRDRRVHRRIHDVAMPALQA